MSIKDQLSLECPIKVDLKVELCWTPNNPVVDVRHYSLQQMKKKKEEAKEKIEKL